MIEELKGKTLKSINVVDDEEIQFTTIDNFRCRLYHSQDCCESVSIEDITGDINDLIGYPLTEAEEVSNENDCDYGHETWTYYKLGTVKGSVTIRWYGSSNGYYSESVDFDTIDPRAIVGSRWEDYKKNIFEIIGMPGWNRFEVININTQERDTIDISGLKYRGDFSKTSNFETLYNLLDS